MGLPSSQRSRPGAHRSNWTRSSMLCLANTGLNVLNLGLKSQQGALPPVWPIPTPPYSLPSARHWVSSPAWPLLAPHGRPHKSGPCQMLASPQRPAGGWGRGPRAFRSWGARQPQGPSPQHAAEWFHFVLIAQGTGRSLYILCTSSRPEKTA